MTKIITTRLTGDVLSQYQKGKISLGKMAELLQMTKWDAIDLLKKERISLQIDEEDIRVD